MYQYESWTELSVTKTNREQILGIYDLLLRELTGE